MTVRKVLHVIPSVGGLRGGPSVLVRSLARDLARAGVETHVATTDDNGPGTLDVPRGVPVVQDDGVTYWYFPRQTRFYTCSWPLAAWLARHVGEFELVHIHALFSFPTLPAAFWARRRRVPYIVRPLGTLNEWGMRHRRPWLKTLSFNLVERRVLRHAALVHYTSDRERVEAETLEVDSEAAIIPNPVAERPAGSLTGRFRIQHPELRGRRILLFLSRLDAKKGLDLLLGAFAQLRPRTPDAALVIAGTGDDGFVDRLKREADAQGLSADLIWAGHLEGDDKQAAFADADLFVLPSYSENFGIAVAEAMAAGLPVIVSDRVAIHDEVTRAGAGVAVPCEAGALADAIVRLLADPAERRLMGANGRQLVHERYSPAAITRKLIDVYNGIVHEAAHRTTCSTTLRP